MGAVKRTHKKARIKQQLARAQRRRGIIKSTKESNFGAFIRAMADVQKTALQIGKALIALGNSFYNRGEA